MIRSKLREIVLSEKFRPYLRKLGRLLVIIGILWIFSFPFIARKVFTSENALHGEFMKSGLNADSSIYAKFKYY